MLGHHRPASETQFKWHFTGGPLMTRLYSGLDRSTPHQSKKILVKVGPL